MDKKDTIRAEIEINSIGLCYVGEYENISTLRKKAEKREGNIAHTPKFAYIYCCNDWVKVTRSIKVLRFLRSGQECELQGDEIFLKGTAIQRKWRAMLYEIWSYEI